MKQSEFKVHFQEYLASIEEAKQKKAHHDQLRSIFVGFLSKAFGVKYDELELEKGVQIAKVKGFIDALYQMSSLNSNVTWQLRGIKEY